MHNSLFFSLSLYILLASCADQTSSDTASSKDAVSTAIQLDSALLNSEMSALTSTNKSEIEDAYLEQARKNIEVLRKGQAVIKVVDSQGEPLRDVKLSVRQVAHEFLLGAIIFDLVGFEDWKIYKPELYKERFDSLFNMAVFPTHWTTLEADEGAFRYDKLEETVKWCQSQGIRTKGHTLAWAHPAGAPKWLYKYSADSTEQLLVSRVENTVAAYKGLIDWWDVLNEPANMIPWKKIHDPAHQTIGSRYDYRGPLDEMLDVLEKCHRAAYEVNPAAELILNDFNQIKNPRVRKRFYQIADSMLRRDIPLHGLGLQAHEPGYEWFDPREVWRTLDYLGELGLPLHITEVAFPNSEDSITGWKAGEIWTEKNQADATIQLLTLAFGHPKVHSFNFWCYTDLNVWKTGIGLIDEEYNPKQVYNDVMNLFHKEWKTLDSTQTNSEGETAITGFYGDYIIEVTSPEGTKEIFDRSLATQSENEWILEISQ